MDQRPVTIALGVFAVLALTLPAGGAGSWSLSASHSVDTPQERFTVEGETFQVSSISRVDGGNLVVSVETTSTERYQINLYNSEKNVQAFRTVNGSSTVTFPTGSLPPGTYVVAAVQDGPQVGHPVVVTGPTVDVTAPETVPRNRELRISADVSRGGTAISEVEAIVWRGDERTRVQMDTNGGGTYVGTVEGLSTGDYNVLVGVKGTESIEGERELVGLSRRYRVQITDPVTTRTPSPTPSPTAAPTATPTPSPTVTHTPSETPSPTTSGTTTTPPAGTETTTVTHTSVPSTSEAGTAPARTSTATSSPIATTTGDATGPITPRESTARSTTSRTGDGFGLLTALGAIALVALLGRLRSER